MDAILSVINVIIVIASIIKSPLGKWKVNVVHIMFYHHLNQLFL
jgi:hypothetical protein